MAFLPDCLIQTDLYFYHQIVKMSKKGRPIHCNALDGTQDGKDSVIETEAPEIKLIFMEATCKVNKIERDYPESSSFLITILVFSRH